jgi:hypothetical protein
MFQLRLDFELELFVRIQGVIFFLLLLGFDMNSSDGSIHHLHAHHSAVLSPHSQVSVDQMRNLWKVQLVNSFDKIYNSSKSKRRRSDSTDNIL